MKKKSIWFIAISIVLITIVILFFLNIKEPTNADIYDKHSHPTVGYVELIVTDLKTVQSFYEEIIGFTILSETDEEVTLTANGESKLLVLKEDQRSIERPAETTGLFHFAILLPTRQDLANFFEHLIETDYPILGASNHLYSEAIYLSDPEGNGIEIYVDRDPELWETDDNGNYLTDTLPVDIDSLFSELGNEEWSSLPDETRIGHMHLQIADLTEAEEFYVDTLGFDIVTEGNGMLFVSKNRYHHHIGMNTWAGAGLPQPPENARGMNYYTLNFTEDDYQLAKTNLENLGYKFEEHNHELWLEDPSGNSIKITKY